MGLRDMDRLLVDKQEPFNIEGRQEVYKVLAICKGNVA